MHWQRKSARSDEICAALGYKTDDIPKSVRSIFKVCPASKSTKVTQFNPEFDVLVPSSFQSHNESGRSGKIHRPCRISLLMLRIESDSYPGITVGEQHNHTSTNPAHQGSFECIVSDRTPPVGPVLYLRATAGIVRGALSYGGSGPQVVQPGTEMQLENGESYLQQWNSVIAVIG